MPSSICAAAEAACSTANRPFLFRLALALTTCAAVSMPAMAQSGNAWPQYGHDAAHSFSNPNERSLKPQRFKDLSLLWSQKQGQFYIGASVQRQGVVYNCSNLYGVNAVQSGTGEIAWQRGGLPGDNCYSAAVSGNTLWVTTEDLDLRRSYVMALNTDTGQLQWTREIADSQTLGPNSPTLVGQSLYVSDGRSAVHKLSSTTGESQWRADTGCYQNQATVGRGQVFISTWYACTAGAMRVIALDANTGAQRWTQPLTGDSWYPPMLMGSRVLATTVDGWVRAFQADTGAPLWSVRLAHYPAAPLVAGNNVVYANDSGTVHALDATTGATLWTAPMPRFGSIASNLVLAAGSLFHTVIESDGTHRLGVINAETGKVGSRADASMFGDFAHVTVAGGRVQVASNYGYLYEYGFPAP